MTSYILKADSQDVVGIAQYIQGYASEAKAKGPNHGLGPPHLYVRWGLITALQQRGTAVGLHNAEMLKSYDDIMGNKTQGELADQVSYARMSRMYNKQFKILEFTVADATLKGLVIGCLNQVGAVRLHGPAPPGGLEVLLQQVLEEGVRFA